MDLFYWFAESEGYNLKIAVFYHCLLYDLRLQSFFSCVMEDSEETETLPPLVSSHWAALDDTNAV